MKCSRLIVLSLLSLFLYSCGGTDQLRDDNDLGTGYYKKQPAGLALNNWINNHFDLVTRIQSSVFYRTYEFNPELNLFQSDLRDTLFEDLAVNITAQNETRAGTAVIFTESNNNLALLTASHIVNHPDTIWHFSQNAQEQIGTPPVDAVSVKIREAHSIFERDTFGPLDLIIADRNLDLAVLATRFDVKSGLTAGTIKTGNSSLLEWADFVYVAGYPKGIKMITSGLVSLTDQRSRGGFSLDASFNRGFSGGIILAANNRTNELEWVGLLTNTTADIEYILTPGFMTDDQYNPEIPYTGAIYIERKNRINYGLSHSVDINQIRNFLRQNRRELGLYGFGIGNF
ncbi:MAG: serine protease [Balneolaceae bacterium]